MKFGLKILALIIGLAGSPVAAQSNYEQFEGEFFTAKVMNVTVAKQNGNIFVTVRFRGKAFDENLRISIGRTGEKADDCGTLLDSNGGQYVAVKCLPVDHDRRDGKRTVTGWTGQGGMIIRPNVDAVQVFQFRPVLTTDLTRETSFDLSAGFFLYRCFWDKSQWGGSCVNFMESEQSLSFFNLKAR